MIYEKADDHDDEMVQKTRLSELLPVLAYHDNEIDEELLVIILDILDDDEVEHDELVVILDHKPDDEHDELDYHIE